MLAYLGRQVPEGSEGSGVCWCRFRRRVPEGSGDLRSSGEDFGVLVSVPEANSGRFRRVPESSGACCSGGRVWKVPESSGVVCCLDSSSYMIVLIALW